MIKKIPAITQYRKNSVTLICMIRSLGTCFLKNHLGCQSRSGRVCIIVANPSGVLNALRQSVKTREREEQTDCYGCHEHIE